MTKADDNRPGTLVATNGSDFSCMLERSAQLWGLVDTILVLESPHTIVETVAMLVDERNNDDRTVTTETSVMRISDAKFPTLCNLVALRSQRQQPQRRSKFCVTKYTARWVGFYSVFSWILLLLSTSPSYFHTEKRQQHTTLHFVCLALSSSSSSSSPSSKPININTSTNSMPWQDRTLKVAFVTGNAMKAREVENIVEEHCYNSNYNMDKDGFIEGSGKNVGMIEMDDIRSDDSDEDYDEYDTEDDDTCALLQLDLTVTSINLPEIQEVDTIAIAKQKAILAAQLVNGPCVVEDTSLEFHALGGMPGPYIKWFQETLKSQGLYNILAAYDNKNATAKCTLAYIPAPHADPILFTGVCHGHIVAPQPKMYGFGWDTIFVPNEHTIPFSQMNMETKNLVSHRGHAVRQWADWLGQNQNVLLERQQSAGTSTFLGHQGLTFKIRPNKNLQDVRK